jgi:hypothetical protein
MAHKPLDNVLGYTLITRKQTFKDIDKHPAAKIDERFRELLSLARYPLIS